MKRIQLLTLVLVIILVLTLPLAGCGPNDSAPNGDENGSTGNGAGDTWNGPTAGPWTGWEQTNRPGQYFMWEMVYYVTSLQTGALMHVNEGWFSLELSDADEDLIHFDYQFYYDSEIIGPKLYSGYFFLEPHHHPSLGHATYHLPYDGPRLEEAVYADFAAALDMHPIVEHFLWRDEAPTWEAGTSSTSKYDGTFNAIGIETIGGITGVQGTMDLPKYEHMMNLEWEFVINPDLTYPIYVKHTNEVGTYVEFTLVEYTYSGN